MVDFRYHLVSLISVFLALAVGIILGAGPLQNSIGEALRGEVTNLRASNEELKAENETVTAALRADQQAFSALAPALLKDTLRGRVISIVRAPDTPEAEYIALTDAINLSGASIGTVLNLTDVWTRADKQSYRAAFSGQILAYVPAADSKAGAESILAAAVNQLAREGTANDNNSTIFQLMNESDTPMLQAAGDLAGVADAVVFLTPDTSLPEKNTDKAAYEDAFDLAQANQNFFIKIAQTLKESGATVVAGASDSEEDTVAVLRTLGGVSTVDSLDSVLGSLNVAIALGYAISGEDVNLGSGIRAGSVSTVPRGVPRKEPAEVLSEDVTEGSSNS